MIDFFGGDSWAHACNTANEIVHRYGLSQEEGALFLRHVEDLILAGDGHDVEDDEEPLPLSRVVMDALDTWVEEVYGKAVS